MSYAVVYLHGFASGPTSAKAVFFRDYFAARGIAFVAPDLNAPAFASLTLTRMVNAAERAAEGFDRVCVIGSSLGGYAAALWAARRPVLAGMLIAPAFQAHRLWADKLPPAALAQWQATGSLDLQGRYGPDCRALDYTFFADALLWDAAPVLPKNPWLVFHGEADDTVPVERSRAFATAGVTLQTFAGEGHGLVNQSQLMADKTLAFFAQADYSRG